MQTGQRPYRSHLRPACLPCRRRKSRCHTESSSNACLMCRAHGTPCQYPNTSSQPQSPRAPRSPRARGGADRGHRSGGRTRTSTFVPISSGDTPPSRETPVTAEPPAADRARLPDISPQVAPIDASGGQAMPGRDDPRSVYDEDLFDSSADDHAQNLHIVGPAATKDSQVLSDYLSAIPGATRSSRVVLPVPAGRSKPVVFTKVQKRPLGVSSHRSPSAEKVEIMENILGPQASTLIDVYFEKINPCFPILDETLFRRQYRDRKDRISPALIACLYAHVLVYWRHSKSLAQHRCPDIRYLWNIASEAVYKELHLSPGMSIIKAILLNVGGLPTTSLIGNGVFIGSATSMAYSLGLNHSPLHWEISHTEKCVRMKIWWTLLVQDRWISLAHGTPPHISSSQNDVPAPALSYLCDDPGVPAQSRPASIFIALVGLTEVLYKFLVYIYQVDKDDSTNTSSLELALNDWVESLSGEVRRIILRGSHLDIPGAPNLRLSYLTIQLLLQRIELEADKQTFDIHDRRLANRYMQARRTAEDILFLTQELNPQQLGDFWLSTHAFSYPVTVNFLLRCGLETRNSPVDLVQSSWFRVAHELVTTLRAHQDKYSWALTNICLAQHAEVVDKILASGSPNAPMGFSDILNSEEDFVMPDASVIDQFFPSLWDPLQNAW